MKKALCPIIVWSLLVSALTAECRPVRDHIGFAWQAGALERIIAHLDRQGPPPAAGDPVVAAVSPHDDYLYAGPVYHPLFRRLHCREAVIFGVTHGTVRKEIGDPQNILLLDDFSTWAGPYGEIAVSPLRERLKQKLPADCFRTDRKAHQLEHSIEALLPWLQHHNRQVRITPIMVTAMPFERMEEISARLAPIIAEYMQENGLVPGRDILFLVSSDANHYGPDFSNTVFGEGEEAHTRGTANDRAIAASFLEGPVNPGTLRPLAERLAGTPGKPADTYWCGRYSIPFGLLCAGSVLNRCGAGGLQGHVLRYDDSYSGGVLPLTRLGIGITAPFSLQHWVGYVAAEFTEAKR